ncbi:MAG: hypothetical protein ABUS47_01110 [Steroidobacter sp.]
MRRILKKIGIYSIAAATLIVLSLGGMAFAMLKHFNASPPAMQYARPRSALEGQRQDLDYFRKLMQMDRSYSPDARQMAERRISALEAVARPLDPAHFRVALMEILALADNGHTHLDTDDSAPKKLPLRVALFSDGPYVMRAMGDGVSLLGGRVVSIDGKPVDDVLKRLMQLRGGNEAWRKLNAAELLVDQDVLYGADIAANPDHSTWTVNMPGGETITAQLTAVRHEKEPYVFIKRWISSEPVVGYGKEWQAAMPEHALPLTFANFDTAFRRVRLEHSCVMLIQLKSNNDTATQHLRKFLDETKSDMKSNPPCGVIFDLRFDDGGDYTNTASFASELPGLIKPKSRIVVLTGASTFSAGITTVAFVKQAGGDRVSIIGEPIGDRLHFFSEGNRGCLPNAHLCVSYERGKHDYAHPCTDWDVCFWLNKLYPVHVESLQPDRVVTISFDEWRRGLDPAFEQALSTFGSD